MANGITTSTPTARPLLVFVPKVSADDGERRYSRETVDPLDATTKHRIRIYSNGYGIQHSSQRITRCRYALHGYISAARRRDDYDDAPLNEDICNKPFRVCPLTPMDYSSEITAFSEALDALRQPFAFGYDYNYNWKLGTIIGFPDSMFLDLS